MLSPNLDSVEVGSPANEGPETARGYRGTMNRFGEFRTIRFPTRRARLDRDQVSTITPWSPLILVHDHFASGRLSAHELFGTWACRLQYMLVVSETRSR